MLNEGVQRSTCKEEGHFPAALVASIGRVFYVVLVRFLASDMKSSLLEQKRGMSWHIRWQTFLTSVFLNVILQTSFLITIEVRVLKG